MIRQRLAEFALRNYKRWLSPALPAACRYVPTCSEFAAEAVAHHGAWRGGLLAMWRVLRCHPFARGGYDPVPLGNEIPRVEQEPVSRYLEKYPIRERKTTHS